MSEIINIVKEWPVIIQGALGSGLFWLFLLISQKLLEKSVNSFSSHSKRRRRSMLISRLSKLRAFGHEDDRIEASFALSGVKYRSLRPLYKGLMWLSLGIAIYPFLEVGLTIGGLGGVYFFVKAYDIVSPLGYDDTTEEFEKTHDELSEMGVLPKRVLQTDNEN